MISIEDLEDKAEQTLRDTDTFRAPVPIHLVAQRLNLGTEALPLSSAARSDITDKPGLRSGRSPECAQA